MRVLGRTRSRSPSPVPLQNNSEGQADQAGIKPGEAITERDIGQREQETPQDAKQSVQESGRDERDQNVIVASPDVASDAGSRHRANEHGMKETGPSASEDANDLEEGGAAGMPPNDTARQSDEDVESYASTTSDRESEVGSEGEANEKDQTLDFFRAIGRVKDGSVLLDTTGYGRQSLGQSDDGWRLDDAIQLLENRGRNWMVVRRHDGQAAPPETICIPKD